MQLATHTRLTPAHLAVPMAKSAQYFRVVFVNLARVIVCGTNLTTCKEQDGMV